MAVLATLSGCASAPPRPTPTAVPSATTKPVFASNAEALAAAKQSYSSYLEVSDAISADGGVRVERLRSLVTPDDYLIEERGAAGLRKRNLHTSGGSKVVAIKLQDVNPSSGTVSAYLCVDYSAVRLLNSTNKDVTPKSRPDRQTWLVPFKSRASGLVVGGNEQWSGSSVC